MTYLTSVRANGASEQAEYTESFSEADMESVQFESAELAESLESEEGLENISAESVAEDVESYMQGQTVHRNPGSQLNRRLTKVFTTLIKTLVKKITTNPRTRAKLQAACRKDSKAVAALLSPTLTKAMPVYFNWLPAIFIPPIVDRLYIAICIHAGLKPAEIPADPEWGF